MTSSKELLASLGKPNWYLNLQPNDIAFVKFCLDRVRPGQEFYIQNGQAIFCGAIRGVTPKGVPWSNVHVDFRENATATIRDRALLWLEGNGIDVGCGMEKIVEDCIGIDLTLDYGDRSAADDIRDASDLTGYADGQFDWLYSSNNLEHISNWETALSEWVRVVRPGVIIFLYLPWPEKCPVHAAGVCESHLWNPTPGIIRAELEKRGVETVECDDDVDEWGTFVIVGRKR